MEACKEDIPLENIIVHTGLYLMKNPDKDLDYESLTYLKLNVDKAVAVAQGRIH